MSSKQSDSAILNLGDIGEENTFLSSINPTMKNMSSTVHTFEDKIPDSALDGDDEGKLPIWTKRARQDFDMGGADIFWIFR